jgi:hypothetical protein
MLSNVGQCNNRGDFLVTFAFIFADVYSVTLTSVEALNCAVTPQAEKS